MKANELMIGDWVYLNYWDGKYPQQIHGINYNSWRGEGYADWVDTDIDDEASIKNVEPIPLTAEILEKNGFKDEDADLLYTFYDGWNFEIHNKTMLVSCGSIWYVHELQHALRLCGLNELADNFQI